MATTTTESISRFAPYVEEAHERLLDSMWNAVNYVKQNNPYSGRVLELYPHKAFTNVSKEASSGQMPALFWNWNRHIQDFNITSLWSTLFDDTTDNTAVRNLISAERDMLEDAIDSDAVPRFTAGMRDLNAVNSSSFVIGRALIEDSKEKEIAKFSAELQYRLLNIVIDRYKTHLSWKSGIVGSQMDALKMFFSVELSHNAQSLSQWEKMRLWNVNAIDYYRVAVGTLQGAQSTSSVTESPDPVIPETSTGGYNAGPVTQSGSSGGGGSSTTGNVLMGAAAGAMIGGAPGAVIGGIAGLISSIF